MNIMRRIIYKSVYNRDSKTSYKCLHERNIVISSFFRDINRGKWRNCVLILFQNRKKITDKHFVYLFGILVELTPCIDFVCTWDLNTIYKYNTLLDEYIYLCA